MSSPAHFGRAGNSFLQQGPADPDTGPVAAIALTHPHRDSSENGDTAAPMLATGAELLGEYQGSGLTEATYLARNPGGQVVHVSRLLHLVLGEVDGSRSAAEIAGLVTATFGRTVSAGNVEYLLANKLVPLGLVAAGDPAERASQAASQDPAILTLKLRRTLLPAPAVQRLARLLRPLFNPIVVAAVLAALVSSGIWLMGGGRLGSSVRYVLFHPVLLLVVLGLSLLSMLFHECGHAAACRYGGARPGVIGMGFYLVFPAFYTNVTDTYRLGRAARVRTDLGGVYFNAIFTLPLAAAYLATAYPPLLVAIVLIYLEISQQLLPSLRFDGYFILADLIGVPDLFRRIVPTLRSLIPGRPADPVVRGLKPRARISLTAWVLVVVPLLSAQLALVILNAPGIARTFARSLDAQAHAIVTQFGQAHVAGGLVGLVSVLLLILPAAGLCYVLYLTGWRAVRFAIDLNRRHPALRYPSVAAVLLAGAALAVHWGL
jgi:putative peptide zinc metalloprotease protein